MLVQRNWMSRAEVLNLADRVAVPNAVVAIMEDSSLWTYEADWTAAFRGLIQTYLGNDRRAGTRGTYAGRGRSYEEDLADSAFSDVAEHCFPVARAWRPEDVLGYLRTTSSARPALFAGRHHEFEAEALRCPTVFEPPGAHRRWLHPRHTSWRYPCPGTPSSQHGRAERAATPPHRPASDRPPRLPRPSTTPRARDTPDTTSRRTRS